MLTNANNSFLMVNFCQTTAGVPASLRNDSVIFLIIICPLQGNRPCPWPMMNSAVLIGPGSLGYMNADLNVH